MLLLQMLFKSKSTPFINNIRPVMKSLIMSNNKINQLLMIKIPNINSIISYFIAFGNRRREIKNRSKKYVFIERQL